MADVELDVVAVAMGLVMWDGVFDALAWGMHFVLLVGVAVADVALDMVAGMVRFVVWDGDFFAFAWVVPFLLLFGMAVDDVALDKVAGVVRFVVWVVVHVAAFVGCAAGASCRGVCSWLFLPAWLGRTWSSTLWRR